MLNCGYSTFLKANPDWVLAMMLLLGLDLSEFTNVFILPFANLHAYNMNTLDQSSVALDSVYHGPKSPAG